MKKCFKDLIEYVSTSVMIDDAGVSVFTNIIGAMSRATNEVEFDTYKDVAETAIVGLIGLDLITEREQEDLLGLLDECNFEESIKMENTNLDEANKILSGMVLYSVCPLYDENDEDNIIGKSFTFHTNEDDEVSKFRTFTIHNNGRMLVSEEY